MLVFFSDHVGQLPHGRVSGLDDRSESWPVSRRPCRSFLLEPHLATEVQVLTDLDAIQ
jgi:hypothetical protein